ncbi:hypothetical protein SCOR_30420 [Sulfidibacter corallicola]|uniref:Uncharacterized protein n=1 Tax=Sulfidibacter corallicola TaxID=2818388 RepID=A0A8A4TUC4_SULCO|nr:hypothetical protein [Sulfidibacter corallicola]QTD50125.1 hypothetical protein J3U87_31460 [Sulfidibacter corallicola]
MNIIRFICLCFISTSAFAGGWYEDWEIVTETIPTYYPYYYGEASCQYYDYSLDQWDTLYFYTSRHPVQSLYVHRDPWGNVLPTGHPVQTPGACRITLPYVDYDVEYTTVTTRRPIQPYPESVSIERLGCNQNRQLIAVSANVAAGASTMKVFVADNSLDYAEHLIYSGPYSETIGVSFYPIADTLNVRVKLDDGSSYYTTLRNAKCSGGGGGGGVPIE